MNKLFAILPNKLLSVMQMCLLFWAIDASATTDELINHAHALRLADDPAWLNLLHMRTGLTGAGHSEVVDPQFFLAATGYTDASAELDATVRAFNEDVTMSCRFPARRQWLGQYLDLSPPEACPELVSWKLKLAAQHLTLLFPAMYLQNPASMFGHTFLRFDQADQSTLLAYTLSYAARPDQQDNILFYVYKGVFGGYPGVFAVQPYYQTVTDYGDIEHRDIWEYSLNLNASELDQLLNHVWELRDKKIDYYFLRENCAYQLLSLIDVARPGLQLSRDAFLLYAIPVDTVRSLDDAGLIDGQVYRPARASRIAHMYAQLDVALQPVVAGYVNNNEDHSVQDENDQARVLELATEIRQARNEDASALLLQRSKLTPAVVWAPFVSDDPKNSHASARWDVAAGAYAHHGYIELGIRPALHDLLGDDSGLIEGAALEVLSARWRYYPETNQAQLQQLKIFSMQSYSPVQTWYTPVSSEINIGMSRIDDRNVFNAAGGVGLSARFAALHCFALATLAMETMPQRDQAEAAYIGLHAGVRSNVLAGRVLLETTWQNSFAGYDETRKSLHAGYQWDMSRRYALRMEYVLQRNEMIDNHDIQLGLLGYF